MSVKNFLIEIEQPFVAIFNKAEHAWDVLDNEAKTAIKEASGVLAIVNANLNKVPDDVWPLIAAEFPGASQANVTATISKALNILGVINIDLSGSYNDAMKALQDYLSKSSGGAWEVITRAIINLYVTISSPATLTQKVEMVLEWVYQKFFKEKFGI